MKLVSTLRFVLVVAVLGLLGLGLLHVGIRHEQVERQQAMYQYYREHFLRDVGAPNAVAAILLTYRMYDTIFEAIILLCSIIGIMHFLPAQRPQPATAATQRRESTKSTKTTKQEKDPGSRRLGPIFFALFVSFVVSIEGVPHGAA